MPSLLQGSIIKLKCHCQMQILFNQFNLSFLEEKWHIMAHAICLTMYMNFKIQVLQNKGRKKMNTITWRRNHTLCDVIQYSEVL